MDEFYFLARYTPFWGVPLLLIAGEFAYLSYLRKKKKWLLFCLVLVFCAAGSLAFYYWAGGPEKTVKTLMKAVNYYAN